MAFFLEKIGQDVVYILEQCIQHRFIDLENSTGKYYRSVLMIEKSNYEVL